MNDSGKFAVKVLIGLALWWVVMSSITGHNPLADSDPCPGNTSAYYTC